MCRKSKINTSKHKQLEKEKCIRLKWHKENGRHNRTLALWDSFLVL
jgi:hypothetical protein